MTDHPAPIAIFAYRRPGHARRLLESVATNPELPATRVFIFCDGPRSAADQPLVAETRRVVRELAPAGAKIVLREENLGLSRSIIAGVSRLCDEHGRAIVLEDDLVVAPTLLRFFNRALDHYAEDDRVMHVSGYVFPTDVPLPGSFFYRSTSCWGWATWHRAWRHFEPDGQGLRRQLRAHRLLHAFDIDGTYPYTEMLDNQIAGRNDSWAVRWYGSVMLRGGLCLHPGKTLVINEGFDGSGEHCSGVSVFGSELASGHDTEFPDVVVENAAAVAAIRRFFIAHIPQPTRPRPFRERWWRRSHRLGQHVGSVVRRLWPRAA